MKGLKALRLAAGIKQKELAERLGVTQAALAHWESGDRNPGLEYITKCREIFNCTYDELIAGPDPADIIPDKEGEVHG